MDHAWLDQGGDITKKKCSLHFFFRRSGPSMQSRFEELVEGRDIPRAFVHGNPHLDNYAKSKQGAAMVDFDRARLGPYAYDVVRFLCSVALRSSVETPNHALLDTVTLSFRRGYSHGILSRAHGYEEAHHLARRQPKRWQQSTRAYVRARRRWAGRLRANPADPNRKKLRALLSGYLTSRDELDLLERFELRAAAVVPGSMGKRHYLFLLRACKKRERNDDLLLDVKEVYVEEDSERFSNPFPHNGERMIAAGALYAPGWELRPGLATYKGREYWGRQLPAQNVKLRGPLSEAEQIEVCYAVGTQLGRAHALSLIESEPRHLLQHFLREFGEWVRLTEQLQGEVRLAHRECVERLALAS